MSLKSVKSALSIVVLAFCLFARGEVWATSIDPATWAELVTTADFVGIVECETAGGIVATYKIIEPWKGKEGVGNVVSIQWSPDQWEPQFPIALTGERYLFIAYRLAPNTRLSTTGYGPIPLWWRHIPADYQLPLFQGHAMLPLGIGQLTRGVGPLHNLGSNHLSVAAFKKDVLDLLALDEPGKEARIILARVDRFMEYAHHDAADNAASILGTIRHDASTTKSAKTIVERLLIAATGPNSAAVAPHVYQILSRSGGPETLRIIELASTAGAPQWELEKKRIVESIQRRLEWQREHSKPKPQSAMVNKQSEEPDIDELHKKLNKGIDTWEGQRAFETLTRVRPEAIADFLVGWTDLQKNWVTHNRGYDMGSYFAWRVSTDREHNLRKLANAKDPLIRVAGAVYLCFENKEACMKELRSLQSLDGDAGAWAALTLARRGEKAAMPRLLQILSTKPLEDMTGALNRRLRERVALLFSDTAKISGLPQPKIDTTTRYRISDEHQTYSQWWEKYGQMVVLTDAWFDVLEKQKVD